MPDPWTLQKITANWLWKDRFFGSILANYNYFCNVIRLTDLPPKSAIILSISRKIAARIHNEFSFHVARMKHTAKPVSLINQNNTFKFTQLFFGNAPYRTALPALKYELTGHVAVFFPLMILFHILSNLETSLLKQMLSSYHWLTSSIITLRQKIRMNE